MNRLGSFRRFREFGKLATIAGMSLALNNCARDQNQSISKSSEPTTISTSIAEGTFEVIKDAGAEDEVNQDPIYPLSVITITKPTPEDAGGLIIETEEEITNKFYYKLINGENMETVETEKGLIAEEAMMALKQVIDRFRTKKARIYKTGEYTFEIRQSGPIYTMDVYKNSSKSRIVFYPSEDASQDWIIFLTNANPTSGYFKKQSNKGEITRNGINVEQVSRRMIKYTEMLKNL